MTGDKNKPSDELDQRLGDLSNKLEKRRLDNKVAESTKGLNDRNGIAYGLKIASEFVSAIVVGGIIGWVFDQWVGTTPFGLIVFFLLGFVAGILNVLRTTGRVSRPDTDNH